LWGVVLAVAGVAAVVLYVYSLPPPSAEELARRAASETQRQQERADVVQRMRNNVAYCLEIAHTYDKNFDAYLDENMNVKIFGEVNLLTLKVDDSVATFQFRKCLVGRQ
jgi:hypothetical protein